MTRRLRLPIVVTLLLAGVAPAFAQAPAGRGGGAPQIQVNSPELLADRRITFRILAPQAQAVRLSAGDIPGARTDHAADQGRERRVGDHRRSGRPGHLSLQLQRRRRGDDRSAQPVHQRVEQQRLEPRPRARLRLRRHEERAARRRRRGDLLLDRARRRSAACTSTRRPATSATTTSTRSSTCCTAPATATTRGRRSGAPASSSTT